MMLEISAILVIVTYTLTREVTMFLTLSDLGGDESSSPHIKNAITFDRLIVLT